MASVDVHVDHVLWLVYACILIIYLCFFLEYQHFFFLAMLYVVLSFGNNDNGWFHAGCLESWEDQRKLKLNGEITLFPTGLMKLSRPLLTS